MRQAKLLPVLLLLILGQGGSMAVELAEKTAGLSCPMNLFAPDNLLAWCIVPYDAVQRDAEQRMAMLNRLGFSQYAWDWRAEHIPQLPAEIKAAQAHHIRIQAVWLWMDERTDRVGQLNEPNRIIIDTVKSAGLTMDYWVGFHANFFAGLDDAACVKKGAGMIAYLREQVGPTGSVYLYNHGDWFGEPENEIKIIKAAGPERLGIVYNLHHAEGQTGRFAELLPRMLPYLKVVNLNGVNPGALDSDIIPLGEGKLERGLIKTLQDSGYTGAIGILGHTEGQDIEGVLQRNLTGLRNIAAE